MGLMNYVSRRVQPGVQAERQRRHLSHGLTRARETLTPVEADRDDLKQGYKGRYPDGGRARFAEMVAAEGLGEAEIEAMRVHHRVLSIVFLAASFGCILGTIWTLLQASSVLETATGITLLILMLTFLSMALRHHYSEWQIRERRFGGLGEFLQTLL